MKNLVIVESPTKARTLSRFLGGDYQIEATLGHIRDLPKTRLGVEVDHDFEPIYITIAKQKKRVAELKKLAQKAKNIILATDPDREGEAIAHHVAEILKMDSRKWKMGVEDRESKIESKKINLPTSTIKKPASIFYHLPSISRIVFHEITESAIKEALSHPREIDINLVLSQQARRILDRLVGYKLSPLLWKKVRRGLSAGRVQSVAVRLIVEREREIKKFSAAEYWKIEAKLAKRSDTLNSGDTGAEVAPPSSTRSATQASLSRQIGGTADTPRRTSGLGFTRSSAGLPAPSVDAITFSLIEKNGEKLETRKTYQLFAGDYTVSKTTIENEEQVKKILNDLNGQLYKVASVDKREVKRTPPPPFTTSTLQQEAGRKFGFSAKQTMSLAQKLYEEGFITYHRTDSVNLSAVFLKSAREFLTKNYGQKYALDKPRFYRTKSKLAQEAHEAIRPTNVGELQAQSSKLKAQIDNNGQRLYEIIWQRAVACQAAEAILETTGVNVLTENPSHPKSPGYKFYTSGSVIKFDGFLKIYPQGTEETILPVYKEGEILNLLELLPLQKFTEPPPRYTEMSLIKTLEEKGIGRPSTYAPIISTIQDRRYVEKQEGKFLPTVLGEATNDFLVKNFPDIVDIPFTAEMEDELDEVAQGEKEWVRLMREFYEPFKEKLEKVETTAERVKVEAPEVDEKCPKCGATLVIRFGRFGRFLACSRFPDCDFTKAFAEKTDLTCPRCGGEILQRRTKRGRTFFGCSNWPKCKFAAWRKEDIEKA